MFCPAKVGLGILLVLLCLFPAARGSGETLPGASPISYRKTSLIAVPWGAKPGLFGLAVPPDGETVGPRTFTVDALGQVYILDTVKKNIKVYDGTGRFQASIGKNLLGYALACHEGFLYLLDGDGLKKISPDGKVVETYHISDRIDLREGYGQWLRVTEDGSLFVKSGRKAYRVFADLEERILPEELQAGSERRGSPNHQGSRWFSLTRDNPRRQLLQIAEFDGTPLQAILLETERTFGASYFLDEDYEGNIYLEIQTVDENDRVRLEVRRYDGKGQLALALPLPNRYHTSVFKKIIAAPDGAIYQMRTEPEGVFVDRWAPEKSP